MLNEGTINRYIAYCRKSTDEATKQVQSLETQHRLLSEFIKENNLNCSYFFQEARSAKDENNRPEFNKILELLNNGEADSILVVHIDRLSRNRIETGRLVDLFQKGKLKEIRTLFKRYNTFEDLYAMDFEFIFSAQYSDRLSQRVKEGNQSKVLKGEFPGLAKIGYLNKDHKIILDPETAPFIKYAFETFARGGISLHVLTETLYDRGLRTRNGKKLHVSGLERVLKAPFYTGKFYFNGILYEGSQEPLVSEDLFDQVQKVFAQRSRPRPSVNFDKFPYRGFLKCEVCGCAITATRKKGHNYYYCTNRRNLCEQHKSYLREDYIESIVGKVFEHITFDKKIAEKSLEMYLATLKNKQTENEADKQKTLEIIDTLKEKKEILIDLLLNKKIDQEAYDKRFNKVKSEIKDLEKKLSVKNVKDLETLCNYVGTIKETGISMKEVFYDGDDEVKRELLKSLCWNLTIKDRKVASVQYKMPWKLFENVSKSRDVSKWLGDRDSNPNSWDQNPESYR